jgi:hypothetical protein
LAVHPPHHVERRLGFAAQGQFQQVFLDARFNGLAQLGLDLEEAVGWTQPFDALVGPLVVVMFDPELDPFAGRLEALELGADQKVLPDGGPEPFDLAQRHGMLRPAFEVGYPVLSKFGFEPAGTAPGGVLAAVVGEHLPGRLELTSSNTIHLDHRLCRGTAEQVHSHDEPRVIVHEGDQVGVTATQPERENVGLPHLVGCGPLEEPRTGQIALFNRSSRWHQLGSVQPPAHRLRAGWQKEPPAQHLTDAFDAKARVLLLELNDLVSDRRRQFWLPTAGLVLQTSFSELLILPHPSAQVALRYTQFSADVFKLKAFLQPQPHGLEPFLGTETAVFFAAAGPPRGALPLPLGYNFFIHVNTPLIIGVSTAFLLKSVS